MDNDDEWLSGYACGQGEDVSERGGNDSGGDFVEFLGEEEVFVFKHI